MFVLTCTESGVGLVGLPGIVWIHLQREGLGLSFFKLDRTYPADLLFTPRTDLEYGLQYSCYMTINNNVQFITKYCIELLYYLQDFTFLFIMISFSKLEV